MYINYVMTLRQSAVNCILSKYAEVLTEYSVVFNYINFYDVHELLDRPSTSCKSDQRKVRWNIYSLHSVSNMADPAAKVHPKFLLVTHAQSTKIISSNFYSTWCMM